MDAPHELQNFYYDLIVIGGGSGGLAASKEAICCGAKHVAVFDFVKPTNHGTTWGLGGTCVNVGCVPKKIMHYAAAIGSQFHHDAAKLGWSKSQTTIDWCQLVETVHSHIRSLNFSYRIGLKKKGVDYINAQAQIESPQEVSFIDKSGNKVILKTKYILIAVGGRPYLPDEAAVPGAVDYAITSDDLFSWPKPPGKTLVVGASYIALECAGLLTDLGFEVRQEASKLTMRNHVFQTTVAVRSILLRSFDRQCAVKVTFAFNKEDTEVFDTIIYATGRKANTEDLQLDKLGIKLDSLGKILTKNEESSVSGIFAIGDVMHGGLELTPVAIRAGELLARRLFGGSKEVMSWDFIPTTIFTPFEYGCIGLSEEVAEERYGKESIEVYLSEFQPLELAAVHRKKIHWRRTDEFDAQLGPTSLAKLICLKKEENRVIGFHYIGRNAGEISQGYALALRLGAKKTLNVYMVSLLAKDPVNHGLHQVAVGAENVDNC